MLYIFDKILKYYFLLTVCLVCLFLGVAEVAKAEIYALRGGGTNEIYKYSISNDSWTKLSPTGDTLANVNEGGNLRYSGGDCIYALTGGYTNDSFYCYSISGNKWTKLSWGTISGVTDGAGMTSAGSNNVYVYSLEAFYYGIAGSAVPSGSWVRKSRISSTVDSYGGIVYAQGYVYAGAGYSSLGFYRYDSASNSWTRMASSPWVLQTVNSGANLAYDGSNYIYAVSDSVVMRYSISGNTWTQLSPNIPTGAGNIGDGGGLVYVNGSLYVLSGRGTNLFYKCTISSTTCTWIVMSGSGLGTVSTGGSLTYVPTTCGNSIQEDGEQCDTGTFPGGYNLGGCTGGTYCSSSCSCQSPVATTVTLSPTTGSLASDTGGLLQITAVALDQAGNIFSATPTWNSSSTSVATVNSTGLVTPVATGTTNVTATVGAVTSAIPATISVTTSDYNVYGWAWSENIGWMSFNNFGYGTDIPAGGGTINYGVNIEPDGYFSGYVWSENLGWIKFDPAADTTTYPGCGYPATPCNSVKTEISGGTTHLVSGWARVCSVFSSGCSGTLSTNRGGWDGWIRMQDDVYIDSSVAPAQFHKWFWGGNPDSDSLKSVIGWGSFNYAEGTGSNYKVVTSFVFSGPPSVDEDELDEVAGIVSTTGSGYSYCNGSENFSWGYTPGTNSQKNSKIQITIDDDSGFTSPKIDSTIAGDANSAQVMVSGLEDGLDYGTKYRWRVKVCDTVDLCSDWVEGALFTTVKHSYPAPKFSVSSKSAILNAGFATIDFTDSSTCYDNSNTSYQCNTLTTSKCSDGKCYTWNFGDSSSVDNSIGDASHIYNEVGVYSPTLKVCDEIGCCTATGSVTIQKASDVPEWKEVSPF